MSPGTSPNLVVVAENPRAGATSGHKWVVELSEMLESSGYRLRRSTDPQEIQEAISEAQAQQSLACVVAAGGDGTIAMLAPWVDRSTPIAVVPLGTENLLAQHLGFTTDVAQTARWIQQGGTRQIDTGLANGKMFLVMASAGFDAHVVTQLHEKRTGHIRHWSYARPILNAIRRYSYPELRIISNNHRKPIKARWAFVFNVPRYAMGLPIVPDADGCDGKLDLCTFRYGKLAKGLIYLVGIVLRRHKYWGDVHTERASKIRIESDVTVEYQLDGDPGGSLPLEIEVEPNRLTFVAAESNS